MKRFEPATSGSTDRRSNQLSYIHHKFLYIISFLYAIAKSKGLLFFILFQFRRKRNRAISRQQKRRNGVRIVNTFGNQK